MTETAIHEAGHAIMFDALDLPMEFVTIAAGCSGEEDSFEGCVKLKNDVNPAGNIILATLAGPAASFFIAGVCADVDAIAKYRSDQKVLIQIHRDQKNVGTWNDFWFGLQQLLAGWIKSWVFTHKEIILRFAELLERAQTLRNTELKRCLDAAWASSKPDVQNFRKEARAALSQALDRSTNI